MKRTINLHYTIAEGRLKPYFDALVSSRALASKCQACARVAFPARIICGTCKSDQVEWVALTGNAALVQRTDAPTRSFALMQFAGADTLSTVALLNPTIQSSTGRLQTPADGRPGLWVILDETYDGDEHV